MSILRLIVAIVIGVVVGSVINMGIVMAGAAVIPPPEGVDPTNAESIASAAHLFEAKHFVSPFLAHAVGTLAGALTAHLMAGTRRNVAAYVVGALFFAGGIAAASMIPAPVWFVAADLLLAYFPMAFFATKLGYALQPAS